MFNNYNFIDIIGNNIETVLVTQAIVAQPRLNNSHNILLANKSSSNYTLNNLEKSNLSSYLAGLIESDGSIIVLRSHES